MKQTDTQRHLAILSFLDEQELLASQSKKFKLHFLFEGLRIALAEAEKGLGTDLDWIWEGLLEGLNSKSKTATVNYILGVFIYSLVRLGSPKKRAWEITSKWTLYSDTRCRDAFYEIEKLAEAETSGFWFSPDNIRNHELLGFIQEIQAKRPFPEDSKKTSKAFNALESWLKEENKKVSLTAIMAAKAQAKANVEINSPK